MPLSLLDLQQRPQPTVDWIIPGFLTRQNTAFIMGPPKRSAKSWLMLSLGWGLAEGLPLWNVPGMTPIKPMRTVYFTQEDTEDNIHSRVRAHFEGAKRQPNDRLWIVPKDLNIKLDTPIGRGLIQAQIDAVVKQAGEVDLVMFDPMRRIHNGNENDSETIAEIWDVIDRIHKRYGCATLISHHTVKPPKEKEMWDPTDPFNGRGSGDIYGGGDAFVVVVPGPIAADGTWRQVTAYFESKRDEQRPPAKLRVRFKTGEIEYLGPGPLTIP